MGDFSAAFFVQQMLLDALQCRASDIHLHMVDTLLQVTFRCNGQLVVYKDDHSIDGYSILRRIKALANLDVSDYRLPLDGVFRSGDSDVNRCEIRVSTMPTVSGESVVLRLFQARRQPICLEDIGLTMEQCERIRTWLQTKSGLILIAGTTGAGKTTTLYAMMRELAGCGRRVMSIEDPVEMRIDGCHQLEVQVARGLTFGIGLRSILRQDPDVLMIGEIRDEETARIALRAGLTGRLVLATTHAHDAKTAMTRLTEFGQNALLVQDTITGVILQSVAASGCSLCRGKGCTLCRTSGHPQQRATDFSLIEVQGELGGPTGYPTVVHRLTGTAGRDVSC